MLAGVTIVDPATTWVEADVVIEPDAAVHPFTVLRGHVVVRAGAEIGPHVVAVDAEIGPGRPRRPIRLSPSRDDARGGRQGRHLRRGEELRIGERSKVPHLSYIGDAEIGEDTNIGAGAITANYRHERATSGSSGP